ncbi:hypothetical protein ABH15_06860 [Methanoculleus taiwanensis]|uniref:Uncharacterized protein n=1 Tax=Methanoculleus taiwanensis TaxID=1550565 RepID=A0A498GZG7_9EURY|nr:hypothetical protein [Methanoculleus taiwanensis]RXE55922.1 hypothetical protein ABH15_06860 [Methanoculleus taiwanensis]
MKLDPIVLGHNQFIGVDHFSQDRARNRTQTFSETHRIIDVIDCFYDLGGRGMMLSTHPKARDIMDAIGQNPRLAQNMNFYPLIPYAQGYIRKANEKGITGMVTETLSPASTSEKFKIMFKGGINVLRKDFISMLSTLIDVELLPFKGFNVKAIFLHNVLTDLALAFKAQNIFEYYIDYIQDNYNTTPAFGTMNFVKLVEAFEDWGLEKPTIMTSFNKAGFQMNPSRESCEQCLLEFDVDVLSMSTLAAGYLKPQEAYEYLFSLPKKTSVVVGFSTKNHAIETYNIIRNYI